MQAAASPGSAPTIVVCSNVSVRGHGTLAIKDLTLEIQRGELFGLMGANGAGKSTLARLIAGQQLPTTGNIVVDGIATAMRGSALPARIAFMAQSDNAPDTLSVSELLHFAGTLRGMAHGEARAAAQDLLKRSGLTAVARRQMRRLPAATRQLARFCATLMGYPRLLVLDEPTANLDLTQRQWVWDLLHDMQQRAGITSVVITHDAAALERIASRVAYLRAGRITALDSVANLKEQFGGGPRMEVKLTTGATLDDRQRTKLRALGQLIEPEVGSFALFPNPAVIGALGLASVPVKQLAVAAKPTPRKQRATAVKEVEPQDDTWLLDRQVQLPGTLGRTIEEIFVIVGAEKIAECWFSPPGFADVLRRLAGGNA